MVLREKRRPRTMGSNAAFSTWETITLPGGGSTRTGFLAQGLRIQFIQDRDGGIESVAAQCRGRQPQFFTLAK